MSPKSMPLRLSLAQAAIAALLLLTACGGARPSPGLSPVPSTAPDSPPGGPSTGASLGATATRPEPTVTPSPTLGPVGPGYMEGFHPLTGLPIADPGSLTRSALLVSVTNFPPSSRPQIGLSQASQVWETSIGQGLTRFLAVYYGDYPENLESLGQGRDLPYGFVIGPVRSGRVAFETIRGFYPEALLVTRAASPEVLPLLNRQITIDVQDTQDVNSAGLRPSDLRSLPYETVDPEDYAHYRFNPLPPIGGEPGPDLRIIYNRFAHVGWEYEWEKGSYLRLQDQADGQGILKPQLDRLTGTPLSFENVVVLFARHSFENVAGTILEIELSFVPQRYGLLFRDGRWWEISWSSRQGQFLLMDPDGGPLALKPGRTFFEVVSFRSSWDPEERLVRFHSPPLPTLTPTDTPEPTDTPTPTPPPSPEPPPSDTPEAATETPTP